MAAAALALALGGCGKANLTSASRRTPPPARVAVGTPGGGERVPVPLPLTRARADAFARAVTLTVDDVPGAHPTQRSSAPRGEEREAEACGGHPTRVVGGGHSRELQRGDGLNRESISSGVEVLSDARAVREDLRYATSHAGLVCYERVLRRSLAREASSGLRVIGVRVAPLGLRSGPQTIATGIRVEARVGLAGKAAQLRLYIDALSAAYGPAELDLYSTSFAQPVPARTEHELLELLRERAQRQRL